MNRCFLSAFSAGLMLSLLAVAAGAQAADVRGHYLEARTCDVYTGPCFANGEAGLAGKDAVMAWSIVDGSHNGVDLAGKNVVVLVQSSHTLGFTGLAGSESARSMILVDETASPSQREALVQFARKWAGKAGENVTTVTATPIKMEVDSIELSGKLTAGKDVELVTRKTGAGDCICSNESAYYPPLAKVHHAVPGVAVDGRVRAPSLGTSWAIPDTRSAYLGMFIYQ